MRLEYFIITFNYFKDLIVVDCLVLNDDINCLFLILSASAREGRVYDTGSIQPVTIRLECQHMNVCRCPVDPAMLCCAVLARACRSRLLVSATATLAASAASTRRSAVRLVIRYNYVIIRH